jgi:hypothetical protein
MLQPLKVATPLFVVSLQPASEPLPVVTAITTDALSEVTVLPKTSSIVTTGWIPNATPAAVLGEGCVIMTSCVGAEGESDSTWVPEERPSSDVVIVGLPACSSP